MRATRDTAISRSTVSPWTWSPRSNPLVTARTGMNSTTITARMMSESRMYATRRGPCGANSMPGAGPVASLGAAHGTGGAAGGDAGVRAGGSATGDDPVPAKVRPEDLGHDDGAVGLLVRLEQGGHD